MKKSKILSVLMVLALAFALVAACGDPAPAPAPTPDDSGSTPDPTPSGEVQIDPIVEKDPVTLKWPVWDIEMGVYYMPLIDAYKEIAPHVTIEMIDLGSTEYETILQTQLIGGSDYDLIKVRGIPQYVNNVNADLLMPLNDIIAGTEVSLDNYQGIPQQYFQGEHLYALPFRTDFWVVFYNKDLFDAAGVDYPTNEMTFADWVEIIKAVTQGEGQDKIYGNQFHWWRSTVTLFGILDGTDIGEPNYGWMAPYYEAVIELEDGDYVSRRIDNQAGNIHHRMRWFPQEVAQINMGSWFIAEAVESEFNWGMAGYPVPTPAQYGNTIGGSTLLAIPRTSPNPEEAFEFIKFVVGAEGAKILASVGQTPAYMTDEALSLITSLPGFPQDATSLAAMKPRTIFLEQNVDEIAGQINALLDEGHQEIMDRTMSIADGIKLMEDNVRQLLGR